MNKLRLELDALEVDSFDTSWLENWEGTVNGAQDKVSGGANTQCGGVHTCGGGCQVSGGGATQCGGVQTCGGGCQVSGGGATQCGGVQTCGDGCKA
ncbi:hypothetical protein [Longimicrobium sp.]|uniref:hypothetical protein n=1 Tax=Longimicrobium sp. TaxID=2029185 RepID=UPI002CF13007|nr:hypothetical protein [Longimicrobium sp.]HSU16624.1 hypothetical protein [Longimicrobium sp.]